jgi:hypothetical protein
VAPLSRLPPSISVCPRVRAARRLVFSELRGLGGQHPSTNSSSISVPENWILLRLKEVLGM